MKNILDANFWKTERELPKERAKLRKLAVAMYGVFLVAWILTQDIMFEFIYGRAREGFDFVSPIQLGLVYVGIALYFFMSLKKYVFFKSQASVEQVVETKEQAGKKMPTWMKTWWGKEIMRMALLGALLMGLTMIIGIPTVLLMTFSGIVFNAPKAIMEGFFIFFENGFVPLVGMLSFSIIYKYLLNKIAKDIELEQEVDESTTL